MKRLKLATIGCGNRAQSYLKIASKMTDQFEIVAAADPIEERRNIIRDLSDSVNFCSYETADDLLAAQPEADAVIIATQDDYHYEPCIKALKNVFRDVITNFLKSS